MKISITTTDDERAALLARANSLPKLLPALGRAWYSGAKEVLGKAVKDRFTGRGPFPVAQHKLGVRTHELRKSLRTTAPQVNGSTGEISISMGSNISYFGPHEFGFKGRVQVKAHHRNAVAGLSTGKRGAVDRKLSRRQISKKKEAFLVRGRSTGGTLVRQHSRRVNIPARAPLGTELADIKTRLTFMQKVKAVFTQFLSRK
ncbi:MAG: hypothetical protein ABIT37_05855 [Luteolibacter sp.]